MAQQQNIKDFASRFGKSGGLGLKLLAGAGALAYTAMQSVYTGK